MLPVHEAGPHLRKTAGTGREKSAEGGKQPMTRLFDRIAFTCIVCLAVASPLVLSILLPAAAPAETATSFPWTRQFEAGNYRPVCLAVDSGAVYEADENYLRQYDAAGNLVWVRDLDDVNGENFLHRATSLSAWGGFVYVAGDIWCNPETTAGDFCGGFIRRYNADGQWAWTVYPETDILRTDGWAVFADASGIYLAGNTFSWDDESESGFLSKYDATGEQLWWRDLEIGTADTCWGVCAYETSVYVSGSAPHPPSDSDGESRFLCRCDASNTWFWTREYDWSAGSTASPVCADAGGVYVADGSSGSFHKYGATAGDLIWTREIAAEARVRALAAREGAMFVAGSVSGQIAGQTWRGGDDAFAARYDGEGNQAWIRQFGSSADDAASAVAASAVLGGAGGAAAGPGGVCLAGSTGGVLPGAQGTGDGFVALLSANAYPERPVNASPAGGATGVSVTPTLQGSAYADADGDAHAASRWQVRSSAGDYVTPVWDSGATAAAASVAVPAGALSYSTSYYWRVGYQDGRGLWSSYSLETAFTTGEAGMVAPSVETLAPDGIGSGQATLRLNVASLGSAAALQVAFEWGADTAYGQVSTPQAMTGPGAASFDLAGLSPSTTYHFRARAAGDGISYGGDMLFTTLSAAALPPQVSTGEATGITSSSAHLEGELTSLGSAGTITVGFVWGTTPGGPYPNQTAGSALTSGGSFAFDLSGLASGTSFYYKARAAGDGTSYGEEKGFTTAGKEPLVGGLQAGSGRQGEEMTVSIIGANLTGATDIDFGAGIILEELNVVSDAEVMARITIGKGAELGERTVTVTTPWGAASIPDGFIVEGAVARVHLWVYVVGAAAGVALLAGLATAVGVLIKRRAARQQP